ncbi:hypothetical protein [Microbacterium pumilum]|uniref:Uncharacterized protein n=1 Tax=Microbacterium pumilum TaxID=344165 RepID=A0ABP5EF63_9MICO
MASYTPGAVVTVGDLEVGDTVFLRERRSQTGGLPQSIQSAVVTAVTPLADGRVRVYVRNTGSGASVPARLLGDLPVTRTFRAAVAG